MIQTLHELYEYVDKSNVLKEKLAQKIETERAVLSANINKHDNPSFKSLLKNLQKAILIQNSFDLFIELFDETIQTL